MGLLLVDTTFYVCLFNSFPAVIEEFNAPGKYPGGSGSRNLEDNLSDLRAQVAANQKGITLIQELIDEYGLNVVQAYMTHIQVCSFLAIRQLC